MGGLVVLNKENYTKEINRLVDDITTYEKLKWNPTNKYRSKLKKLTKKAGKKAS